MTATADPTRFTIPVGWADYDPTFVVSFSDTVVAEWARTSVAVMTTAITTTLAEEDLKVCWGYGGSGTYVEEIGLVTFTEPPVLAVEVSFTTTERVFVKAGVVSFSAAMSACE